MKVSLKELSLSLLLSGMMIPSQMFAQDTALQTATFDDLALEKESFWNGSDLTGSFTSGSFKFLNHFEAEFKSWEGFSYANMTSTSFTGYFDSTHYNNAVGGGYNGSANYVITNVGNFYGMTTMEVVNPSEEGENLTGFYITNAACAIQSIKNGDGYAKAFEKGDWLMLTITEPNTGKTLDYYLADYRSENEADHYALDTWQWVDLRELGKVKSLQFKITGSDVSSYGFLNTPSYFCMDDFNGQRNIQEAPMQILQVEGPATVDLSSLFTFEDDAATVTYSFDGIDTENNNTKFEVNGNQLIVSGADAFVRVTVKAVQKGKIQYMTIPVIYSNSAQVGTFDDLTLEKESFWKGADLSGAFYTGRYKFKNTYDPQYGSWSGFAYSNVTTTEFIDYADKSAFGNVTGSGHNSDNYGVGYCMAPIYMDVVNAYDPITLEGFYLTNSNYSYSSMKNGDGYSQKFKQGDYLLLTVRDITSDKKVECYLADFRSENEDEHYILDTWQWVDLRSLGDVTGLEFVVTGSQNNNWGLLTPAYFCIDDINGEREITEAPAQLIKEGEAIDLAQFFTFENSSAAITYTIDEYILNSGADKFEIKDGQLIISSSSDAELKILVKAVQKGKVQYVWIPISFTTSVEGIDVANEKVTEIYTIDGKHVNNAANGVNIIRTDNGNVKKVLVK